MPMAATTGSRPVGSRLAWPWASTASSSWTPRRNNRPSVASTEAAVTNLSALARSYESAGRLPRFSLHGADVANVSALRAVVRQVAFRGELILLCGDGSSGGSPNALNTALQFYALRLAHVLFVSDSAKSCDRLRAGLPDLACVWSSRVPHTKPQNGGGCVRRFWDMRFYFYDVRKHLVSQLAGELGVNVLQTDTDVAWFDNPYGELKSGQNARANILAQWDAPFVNAGIFYAQNLKRGDAATWVLSELHRRIALFMYSPDAVSRYVPWAKKPYFANADEQTLMNDVLISSMTNTSCYIWSTAFFESRYGGAGKSHGWMGWSATRESKMQPYLIRQCSRSKLPGTDLHVLKEPHGGPSSTFKRGASTLYNHYLYLAKQLVPPSPSSGRRSTRQRAIDLPAAAREAAREQRPISYSTHAPMPSLMVHLAGIRTGAWSRRAIMRAHGWWHPEADALIASELGWGWRRGHLRVGGGGIVHADSRAQLDVLAGNLMLLALLTGRLAVVPETPCSFVSAPRSCLNGCAPDSAMTAARASGLLSKTLRCAWLAPKRCWRSEFSTQIEFDRWSLRGAAAAASGRALAEASIEGGAGGNSSQEPYIPPSELPSPPLWPQGEGWQSVSPSARAPRAAQRAVGGRRRERASSGEACRSDGDWLVSEFGLLRFNSSLNANRGNRTGRWANSTVAQRRSLARMIHSLVCASDGGVAELWKRASGGDTSAGAGDSGGEPTASAEPVPYSTSGALPTPPALQLLMREPLIRPATSSPHWLENDARGVLSIHAYKAQLSEFERAIRALMSRLRARTLAGDASATLGRVANWSLSSTPSPAHEVDCIAELLAPGLPPPPPPPRTRGPAGKAAGLSQQAPGLKQGAMNRLLGKITSPKGGTGRKAV